MRIMQVITDYIMRSILTTKGDMVVRGDSVPEKLAGNSVYHWFRGGGVGEKPVWTTALGEINVVGDLIVCDVAGAKRLPAVAVGQVLKSMGVGARPQWGVFNTDLVQMKTDTYTGNGVNDRDLDIGLNLAAMSYKWMIIKSAETYYGVHKFGHKGGDETDTFEDSAHQANRIQTWTATGVQLGDDTTVNANGVVYHYAVFYQL